MNKKALLFGLSFASTCVIASILLGMSHDLSASAAIAQVEPSPTYDVIFDDFSAPQEYNEEYYLWTDSGRGSSFYVKANVAKAPSEDGFFLSENDFFSSSGGYDVIDPDLHKYGIAKACALKVEFVSDTEGITQLSLDYGNYHGLRSTSISSGVIYSFEDMKNFDTAADCVFTVTNTSNVATFTITSIQVFYSADSCSSLA